MKKIITLTESDLTNIVKMVIESNNNPTIPKHIQRRYSNIKDAVNDYLLFFDANQLVGNFDDFRSELAWDVANEVLSKSKNDGDYVTSRNQMIQFIKNHFYEELKEYYDRNNYWSRKK
jgi:flagellum-specific peptidoglycan hydrolase FlgJ